MRYLNKDEEKKALEYFHQAMKIALKATCKRSRCGSLIVKEDTIIWIGFNSPPLDKEDQRRCSCNKDTYDKKVTDKTCCIHAEQRAIMDALRKHPNDIAWSTLYFIRLSEDWEPSFADKPYCTICSKMALDAGIKEFVLWHEKGICIYDTDEYNTLSFNYSV